MFQSSQPKLWCLLTLVVASMASRSRADQVCHTVAVPTTATTFDVEIAIPRFDTAFGTLQAVTVTFEVEASAASQVESVGGTPSVGSLIPGVSAVVKASDSTPLASGSTTSSSAQSLAAYDGTLDYAGISGVTVPSTTLPDLVGSGSTTDSGTLGLYAGSPGNPGLSGTRVRVEGIGTYSGTGSTVASFSTQASVSVTVCYTYLPRVTSLCFGDGSGTACPCGNESTGETGCLNSFGFGSLLSATGGAAVSADTLTLSATVPGTNTTLFFQGTSAVGGGSGEVFGDGLHCAGGTTIELISLSAVGGVAQFPRTGDPLVSEAGYVSAGVTRYYQAWYRNSASFCTESTWNLSNALQVAWGS
ncbi:MAG: choice-of-anchor E domain-containing protein [Planctomycetota bacterium]|nr:choice-of-anchor E domain-containing protein [Planctomycetota bacterium]